jgi:hypothetical protein
MVGFDNHPGAFKYSFFIDEELAMRVKKGQFSVVPDSFAAQLHPLDVVPKGSGGYRLILDCRLLNSFMPDVYFRLENLATLPQIVSHGAWMFSTDLEDAYFHIPIHPSSLPHLCFRWRDRTYCSNVLPFGLGLAPWVFTKTLRPLVRFCRSIGISMIAYLDDFLWSAEAEDVDKLVAFVRALLERMGFTVSEKKSHWSPSQLLLFLGLLVNSDEYTFEVPPERLQKLSATIAALLTAARGRAPVPVRLVAKVCGHLLSLRLAVSPARIFSRALYGALASASSWSDKVTLSAEAMDELEFWASSLCLYKKKPIVRSPSSLFLHSDASDDGWGAHLADATEAFGLFPPALRAPLTSSTHRELLGLLCALRSPSIFTPLKNSRVTFVLDSLASVYNLNKGGGPVPELSALVKQIWLECARWGIDATAEWISRDRNERADQLSKFRDTADWALHPSLFAAVDQLWGPHTVDRFASAHNAHCRRFNSRYYDAAAEAVDAFALSWRGENNYAFPPFDMIAQTLAHAQRDFADLTLIFPFWPAQPWFNRVMAEASALHFFSPACPPLLPGPRSASLAKPPDWPVCAARFLFSCRHPRTADRGLPAAGTRALH